jgi:hypothetical protein
MVGIQDFHVVAGLDVGGGHRALAGLVDGQQGFAAAVELDRQALEIQQDVDHVFLHAVDGGVFVHDAGDADLRRRIALHGRQQDAAQGITQGVAIATLERLQRDAGLTRGNAVDLDDTGFQQFTAVRHNGYPSLCPARQPERRASESITWNRVRSPGIR